MGDEMIEKFLELHPEVRRDEWTLMDSITFRQWLNNQKRER